MRSTRGKMPRVTTEQSEQTAFARALLVLLNDRGWSQRRVARAMGLTHPQVRPYLDGTQEPGFFKVVALADEAQVSLDWLAGREDYLPSVEVDGVRYAPASSVAGNGRGTPPVVPDIAASADARLARRAPAGQQTPRQSRDQKPSG